MNSKSEVRWTKMVQKNVMSYPSEYVIRIFKGTYPHLDFDKKSLKGKKICDVGCGDGRNLFLLNECGFKVSAVEVNQEIVDRVKQNIAPLRMKTDVRVGTNDSIPFKDKDFDFLLSWNACYYLGEKIDFNAHVKEFARVLKKNGYLVLSIPKKTCFIYRGGDRHSRGYTIVRNDPFNVRNGIVLRMFSGEKDIEDTFSPHFKNFVFASIEDDCFGLNYHWHLVVCQRK